MRQPGIENRQPLLHTRRQRDFFAVSSSVPPLRKGGALRMTPGRHRRAHGQPETHLRPTSPKSAPAPPGPAVRRHRRPTAPGRDVLPREFPPRGVPVGTSGHAQAEARATLPQVVVCSPQRAGPQPRLPGPRPHVALRALRQAMGRRCPGASTRSSPRGGAVPQAACRAGLAASRRARSSCGGASGSGRGVGRLASAPSGPGRGPPLPPCWPTGRSRGQPPGPAAGAR